MDGVAPRSGAPHRSLLSDNQFGHRQSVHPLFAPTAENPALPVVTIVTCGACGSRAASNGADFAGRSIRMAAMQLPPLPADASASDRPVRLRCRGELEFRPVNSRGRWRWHVRDPITLRYFQLDEAEYTVLRSLDGRRNLDEIRMRVERKLAPRRLTLAHLQAFLAVLHQQGLVVADAVGQGTHLLERQSTERKRRRRAAWANPLAIRLPGVDPSAMLDWLYPKCRWLFAWQALAIGCAFAVFVALRLGTRGEVLVERLPDLGSLTSAAGIVMFLLVVAMTKVLHELGHALTCRHFGGRCHEMGLMLLVFSPCLYSNVSQAWMIPEKRRRIAISAAGIVVELMLAAVCGFLWSVSEPGLFNTFCLYVAMVCSLATVLINGNPLLRFDGYYILSDWLEIPNLAEQSTKAVRGALSQIFLGVEDADDRFTDPSRRAWLLSYGVLSTAYRLALTAGILWFIYAALEPRGLALVAEAIAALTVVGILYRPVADAWKFIADPMQSGSVNWRRLIAASAVLLVAIVVLGSIPLPRRVTATGTVEPAGARRVYVPVAGLLHHATAAGKTVAQGDVLASLSNSDLAVELARIESRYDEQHSLVDSLMRRQISDAAAGGDLPTAREVLSDLKVLRDQRRRELRRLAIEAPISGTVFDPPKITKENDQTGDGAWHGSPLDAANVGVKLDVGTTLCIIGDAKRWEAIAAMDEDSVALVRAGQSARIQLDAWPGVVIDGKVIYVSEVTIDDDSSRGTASTADGEANRGGSNRTPGTKYQVRIALEPPHPRLLFGAVGTVKIDVRPSSLGSRVYESFRRTFSIGP